MPEGKIAAFKKRSFMFSTMKISITGAVVNMMIFGIGMIGLNSSAAGCSQEPEDNQGGQEEMAAPTIEDVLKEHTDEWMSIPGVVGTGIGECEGKPCIRILVAKKTPELLKKIPSKLEGFVVDVQETGEIRARDSR